jgi:hypothetical protein
MVSEDMEIISAIFAYLMIREGFGKLYCIQQAPGFFIDVGGMSM